MKTRLHIYRTKRTGALRIVAFQKGRQPRIGRSASWTGPTRLLTGQRELKSGATTWIETSAPVRILR
jgi:hypothetical protein